MVAFAVSLCRYAINVLLLAECDYLDEEEYAIDTTRNPLVTNSDASIPISRTHHKLETTTPHNTGILTLGVFFLNLYICFT